MTTKTPSSQLTSPTPRIPCATPEESPQYSHTTTLSLILAYPLTHYHSLSQTAYSVTHYHTLSHTPS